MAPRRTRNRPGPRPDQRPRPNQRPNQPPRKDDDKGKGKPKPGSLRRSALRDVQVGLRPYLQELAFQRQQAEGDTQQQLSRLGHIYGGLDTKLQQLGGGYGPQAQAITDRLQGDMGEWGQYLGSVSPAGELEQAGALFGNIGAGAIGEIGAAQQRALDFNTSAQRQGAIEQMTSQRNALVDLDQLFDEINQRRLQATRGVGQDVLSRMDTLRQQQAQFGGPNLALMQFRLQQRLAEAQRQYLIDQLNFRGRR